MYSQIYLDYNATTPCAREVMEAMNPYFREHFGNPSSSHHPYGWLAKSAVEDAKNQIATYLGTEAEDMVFTSGSTESINMIIKGVGQKYGDRGRHIITSKTEHKAVLDTCAYMESLGFEVTYLDVEETGLVDMEKFRAALRPDTILVSIMYANNETGLIQPLEEIAALTHANGSLLFSDATQALGKVPVIEVLKLVDFACFSGHKVYGPKGIGLAYIRNSQDGMGLPSLIHGGGQQKGQRGGTINTPLIIGLARAIEYSMQNLEKEADRQQQLRDQLEKGLLEIELAASNNKSELRLPNTSNISFPYVDGEKLLTALSSKLAVSNGSACNSASVEPSHVLLAMGVERSMAYASLRLSIGRYTTAEEIERTIQIIKEAVEIERENNILWERHRG